MAGVADLLPVPFGELTIDHVRAILDDLRGEGETLFFERKRQYDVKDPARKLAPSCASFANTQGGLLLVGVEDETNGISGITLPSGEPELWLTNVLRTSVLPLPPVRARFIPLDDGSGLGVFAVLVRESSTTPHLLIRAGAIYVRNPKSNDPVPIADQAQLLDLMRRGREARGDAVTRAREMLESSVDAVELYSLALAPTGISSDVVDDLYRRVLDPRLLDTAVELHTAAGREQTHMERTWTLNRVLVRRFIDRGWPAEPEAIVDGLIVDRDGAILLQRCLTSSLRGAQPEPRGPGPVEFDDQVRPWLVAALRRGRELLNALGAHGDLRMSLRIATADRHVFYAQGRAEQPGGDFWIEDWVDPDPGDESILDQAAIVKSQDVV